MKLQFYIVLQQSQYIAAALCIGKSLHVSKDLITCFNLTDTNQPSELIPLLERYILPYMFATLALLILCITVIVVVCIRCFHGQCLACCYKACPDSSKMKVISNETVCHRSKKLASPPVNDEGNSKIKAKGAQWDKSKSKCTAACSWQSFLRVVCCLKTQDEEEARKRLEKIKEDLSKA